MVKGRETVRGLVMGWTLVFEAWLLWWFVDGWVEREFEAVRDEPLVALVEVTV